MQEPESQGNRKAFIDYDNELKNCLNCFQLKTFDDFSLNATGYPRPICKQCRSSIEGQRQKRNLMKLKPDKYVECKDEFCGNIQRITSGKECKKCGRKV